jgi:4'-phosphopantetheinyl transferase
VTEVVDIWVVPLERSEPELRRLYEMLAPDERARAGTLPLGPRKRRYVARQAVVRAILAERVGTRPERLPLVRSVRGKPRIAGPHEVRFSVSDSGDLALVAVAGREVGVDVERVRDRPAAARAAALGLENFFERWTRREATGKALGTGLFGARAADRLACTSIDVGPGYAAAVAVAADGVQVRLRPY